ncbi:Indoleamine 2,3-dioxygenase [Saccharopolyspora shandongensis]|uniref:Indoleamine 2,3-dioxygenase n=1 Tax=Saccharopolyspora shandongensis TaxID=418495 RepID=A0A1H3U3J6_9PSEU|nr:hypothetical protein [Saccharopolyspora shandongensis]SDZ57033.1 Indoleamine 2,3-dioxygenase [Saccharopolyspora shandongensis]
MSTGTTVDTTSDQELTIPNEGLSSSLNPIPEQRSVGSLERYVVASYEAPAQLDGDLTFEHGFLPRRLHTTALTGAHAVWEDVAAGLPDLAFSPRAQAVLSDLPLLPAGPEDLPDHQVKWASTLLGMIAHSYWRFGLERLHLPRNSNISAELPDSIKVPWTQVCQRMGRTGPCLTLEDWVFNNFTFIDKSHPSPDGDYRVEDAVIESIRPVVPAYGNETERVFTSSFVDIHAASASAVKQVCQAQRAIELGGPDGHADVAAALLRIAECARGATRAFRKVSPRHNSKTFCDPVAWAKTLVTWTVPPPGYPAGPSGSASPLVHLMDAVIGRTEYDSDQGRFGKMLRGSQLPRRLEQFFDLICAADFRGYVLSLRDAGGTRFDETQEAFNELVDAFAGPHGFLGVHKGKVVDYLGVGTVVGRNQSTAHDQTYIADSSWTAMADRLHISIGERDVRRV